MNKRIYGVAAAVVALGAVVPGAAYATARARKASGAMSSCVDYNNNGICDAGDAPLAPLLAEGTVDTTTLTPPAAAHASRRHHASSTTNTAPIGVVLGDIHLSALGANIVASGNVTFSGRTDASAGGFIHVTTHGSLNVLPKAKIKSGEFGATLVADDGGSVNIAPGAKIWSNGDVSHISILGNDITIGDGASIVAHGYNAGVAIGAAGRLTVGENVTIEGVGPDEGPGSTRIQASSDITFDHATLGGRGVEITAKGNSDSPARHIKISNSSITIPFGDGSLQLQADPGTDGVGSNVLDNVRLNPANAHIDASPAALITNTSKHS